MSAGRLLLIEDEPALVRGLSDVLRANGFDVVTAADGEIVLNDARETVVIEVANSGDRPIQVGSHYHFVETNRALVFDRDAAYGMRLDIPAGTAVRFEPGEARTVPLVAIAGARVIRGGNAWASGPVTGRRHSGSGPKP